MIKLGQQFFHSIFSITFRLKLSFTALVLLLLLLPGQNDYQSLIPHPQLPRVKAANITLPALSSYPQNLGVPLPQLSARSAIAIDADSAVILYQKNPDFLMMPASTTKIMTALVALDNYSLDEILTVKEADESIGHSMHLVRGEKLSVENLLYGILVESGNDAALTLAQNYPGGYQEFVNLMNLKAKKLNLINTSFRNVSGVEQAGHTTTVRDLAILAKAAMENPIFAKMVATKTITVASYDGTIIHRLENINELLGIVSGLKGVKTGWTEHAGECLVSMTERQIINSQGQPESKNIITVVLGSLDRFGESRQLIEWAFTSHKWEKINLASDSF